MKSKINKLFSYMLQNEQIFRILFFVFSVTILWVGSSVESNIIKIICFLIVVPMSSLCLLESDYWKTILKVKE